MSLESDLFTFLTSTNAAVSALISTRLHVGFSPQGEALPKMVMNRLFTNRLQKLEGSSDLPDTRIQFSCFAVNQVGAIALADALRGALNDYSAVMGSTTIQHASLVDETDLFNPSPEAHRKRTYGRALDFSIWYEES